MGLAPQKETVWGFPEGAFLLMPGAYKIDTIICMICLFLNRDTGYNERKR